MRFIIEKSKKILKNIKILKIKLKVLFIDRLKIIENIIKFSIYLFFLYFYLGALNLKRLISLY